MKMLRLLVWGGELTTRIITNQLEYIKFL